jgi:hypothetical protein
MNLAQDNLPLVGAMVKLMVRKRPHLSRSYREEMVAEGNLALVRAAVGFDPSRGFKFSTYACRAIINAINGLWRREGKWEQVGQLPAREGKMRLVVRPPKKIWKPKPGRYREYMRTWRLKNRERINASKRAWLKARAA